ncbi:MAG: S-layer homology domain-containing protein, partial [Oscillospiraceae bacterium]|nr:S-layer homology domain-containing protein [Oscillospiraceae bacterium]
LPDGSAVHYLYYDRVITDVNYDSNGGTAIIVRSRLYYGGTFASFPVTTRTGYTFAGWYTGISDASQRVTLGMAINAINPDIKTALTLYAHWTPNPPPPPPSGPISPPKPEPQTHYAYIEGRDDGHIHPEANITRAETATIFYRLLSDTDRTRYSSVINSFPDVTPDAWYNRAISTLASMGILKGYDDGTFKPDGTITRAEYAAIAARFGKAGSTVAVDVQFTDISGHWAAAEILATAHSGWIVGYEDGTFRPENNITRAEAITLTNRVLNRVPQSLSDLLPGMKRWPDNADTNVWYYLAVQEATNSHSYLATDSGEKWVELLSYPVN